MWQEIMMRISALIILACAVTLTACKSEDYAPGADTDPKAMFEAACLGCHVPTDSGKAMALSAARNNPEAVAAKIGSGSMSMPKFPNIKGAELKALSTWVVANSEPK